MSYDNGITFDSLGHTPGQVDYVNVLDRNGNPLEYEIPRWKANFKYKRRYSPAIAAMMDNWDSEDPWGSASEIAWAVAKVARAMENSAVPIILSVRWSPVEPSYTIDDLADDETTELSFAVSSLAESVRSGLVEDADLTFAARVLNRYLAILDRAGESY